MATKKPKAVKAAEPVIIRGSHSTRTEYPDGRVEFVTHWDELVRDVQQALDDYALTKMKPAVKAKVATRKKKTVDKQR